MKKVRAVSKIFGRVCQNCFLRVQRKISAIDVYFEKLCSHLNLLGHWVKKFHQYAKIFWPSSYTVSAGCQNCLLYVLENSLRESVFFGNRHSLLTFSNTDWKTFGHLSNVFGGGSPNWFLREQRYKLSGKEVSEKITFYRFRLLGKNFFSVWLENFWRDFQKYILRVQRNIFRINAYFENLAFFSHFWRQRKFFRPFGKVFSASLPKLHSTCPSERFAEEKAVLKNKLLFLILGQRANIFGSLAKCCNMIVETVLYVSIGTFWRKRFFLNKI